MKIRFLYTIIVGLLLLSFTQCAKRGRPSGGKRDTIPPTIVKSVPENFTTAFKENEIRIYFNEYIKLKNLSKELIISPPLKYTPIVTPVSTSKFIKIKILDTLLENTTYSFNFGKSIVDNNEENEYPQFKYIFSTGSYIDSLTLSGTIKDAKLPTLTKDVFAMLYEVTEDFKDSVVFNQKPTYVTIANDSTGGFTFENLKEGTYLLTALQETVNDYIFQPRKDKIGFLNQVITVPTDSSYALTLFKEIPPYEPATPKHVSKNHIIFGYEGEPKELAFTLLTSVPDSFAAKTYHDIKKDTIHYWFKPPVAADTLLFLAKEKNRIDSLFVRMKDLYRDSLQIKALNAGTMRFDDTLKLLSNTPIEAVLEEKILITDKDTLAVAFTKIVNKKYNTAQLFFPKEEDQRYQIKLFPGAITDFFGNTNDTLQYRVTTKSVSDYGSISLTLENVKKFPIIVQLVSDKFKLISETYLTEKQPVNFDLVNPGKYYIRLVFDTNKNGKWDTGDFLLKKQPERIVYYPSVLEVRPNWSLQETFTLDN